MKNISLISFTILLTLTSSNAFASEASERRKAKKAICARVLADHQESLKKDDNCMAYDLEDDGSNYTLTIPMCGGWSQYAIFEYSKSTGEILEGSYGDASEECSE